MSAHGSPPLGSPTLVLVPSGLEVARLEDEGGFPSGLAIVRIAGFGPIAAAARTAQLVAALQPARVLLVGIAGAYDVGRHPLGSALGFGSVAVEGIGVGEGAGLIPPPALGFPQWPGSAALDGRRSAAPIADTLPLDGPFRGLLLTTCAASSSKEQAAGRRARFPDAIAEDMEAFAVALACRVSDTPIAVVRGISNEVGDRDPASWRIPSALAAARRLALELLESERAWEPSA